MSFKKIRKVLITGVTVFFLCSFTGQGVSPVDSNSSIAASDGNGDGGEDKFDEELHDLDPRLDEYNIMGEDHVEVDNELSEEDKYVIGKFITRDEGKLTLHEEVYKALPVNDLGLSPERYQQETGEEYPLEKNFEFLTNYKKLTFVSDNIDLMNFMVENDYGVILEDGTLEVKSDDFIQQSFFMNYHTGWGCMKFTTNFEATMIIGILGMLVNRSNFNDIGKVFNATKDELAECLMDVGWDLLQDTYSYWGNLLTQKAIEAAGKAKEILDFISMASWKEMAKRIFRYVLSHYVPGFLKSAVMVLGGLLFQYGANCEIGIWWSNYDVLYYRVV